MRTIEDITLELDKLTNYKKTLEKLIKVRNKNYTLFISIIALSIFSIVFFIENSLLWIGFTTITIVLLVYLSYSFYRFVYKLKNLSKMKSYEINKFIDYTASQICDLEKELINLKK